MKTHRVTIARRGAASYGRPRQRGTVMLLFAMVVFAILGTIAVAIEVGFVRVNRERMQSAADATALEVMRERDIALVQEQGADAATRELGRRNRNRWFASWTFAGQLASSYEAGPEGAGFNLTLSGGSDDFNSGQLLVGASQGVPVPELNMEASASPQLLNAQHGDIVTGTFTGQRRLPSGSAQEFDPAGYTGLDGNPIHLESADYSRVDFQPGGSDPLQKQSAVVVRQRRTVAQGYSHHSPLDVQPGVSSSGWTLPLAFGAGAGFRGEDPDQGYSVRHHGLSLRATAIAAARPALRVGAPAPELGPDWAVGAAPVTLLDIAWRDNAIGWVPNGDGTESVIMTTNSLLGIGETEDDHEWLGLLCEPIARRVGDRVVPLDPNDGAGIDYRSADFWAVDEGYAPSLYREQYMNEEGESEGWRWYVAGFFRLRTELHVDSEGQPILSQSGHQQIKMTRFLTAGSSGPPFLAARNASATLDGLQDAGLPTVLWDKILRSLEQTPDLVQAPVLVR